MHLILFKFLNIVYRHKIFSRKKIVDQNDEIDVFEVDVNDGNREKQQKLTYA